jgi:trimeric autotransporter adhesin
VVVSVTGDAEINYLNTDRVTVSATAVAEGKTENATATAIGAGMIGLLNELTVDFLNDHGKIHVTAYAEGEDTADATAIGVQVFGNLITEESMIVNRGEECCDGIFVEAIAVGPNGTAFAAGIDVLANAFDGLILNDRAVIKAYAEVDSGKLDDAQAFGIRVVDLGGAAGTLGTIENRGGQIWAGISDDGGATIHRGVAIETRFAPNPMDILLTGEEHWGNIFGHINISDDDTIVVSNGVTSFDGIVNSDGKLFGEMTVADGGIFFMRLNEVDGASQVNVREFTQEPDGTIWFEINATPFATAQAGPPDNFIGQINGDIVELAGTATLRPRAGIYQNFFVYEEVVTAQTSGTGEWDEVNSTSPLLDPEAIYNPGGAGDWDTVDIEVTRIAFDAVAGLTKNQASVGGGIEAVYPDLLAGVHAGSPFETLVGTLFTLNDVEYPDALRQLSGAEHAQGLWSVTNSLDLLKRAENARSKYGGVVYFGPPVGVVYKDPVVMADPVPPARGSLWVNAQGTWAEVDGDKNAPGFDHDRASIHAGVDYMIMPHLTLGLVGGYFSADLDFDTGSSWDYDGFQIGGYGKYDWEQWYVNGIIGYGNYDGKSRREIAFGPTPDPLECDCFADPNDFLTSVNRGKFDAHAWMISGELGHRFQWSETGWVAPYIGVTYQQGNIDSFTETAVGTASGSALRVRGKGDSLVTDLGVRLAHSFMVGGAATANAELRVAWLHEFGDSPHDVNMNFAGIAGSNFKIVGSKISRDTFAFDPGVSVDVTDQLRLGLTYHGRFNSDVTEHGVMGRAIFHF